MQLGYGQTVKAKTKIKLAGKGNRQVIKKYKLLTE
jgi:hypothetical protein